MNGASSYSGLVDNAFIFILGASVLMLIGVTVAMITFVVKDRRSKNPNPAQIEGNVTLETLWTVLPTILVLVMFYKAFGGFDVMTTRPDNAMKVKVTELKWRWVFEYPNGKKSDELYVPVDQAVELALHSPDVIHSFFVPAFRIKKDVVPGKNNWTWFEATEKGSYNVFCAEYCGTAHSKMIGRVVVLDEANFKLWEDGLYEEPAAVAQKLEPSAARVPSTA